MAMPDFAPSPPNPSMLWDVFCRVIDNHGDLGVCWRLACHLAARGQRFDVIFLDPPYQLGLLTQILPLCPAILNEGGLVYAETGEALPLDAVDATLAGLIRRLLLGSLLTLAVSVVAIVVVLRRGLRPLDQVAQIADAVAGGERDRRIPSDRGPAEIRALSSALDRMLVGQQATITAREGDQARLRRFIADASHELSNLTEPIATNLRNASCGTLLLRECATANKQR